MKEDTKKEGENKRTREETYEEVQEATEHLSVIREGVEHIEGIEARAEDTSKPFDLIKIFIIIIAASQELIDYLTSLLNATGAWIIVAFIFNIICVLLILALRIIRDGFDVKKILGTWKQLLWLVVEFFPVVGDLIPGMLFWVIFGKKKGAKGTAPEDKKDKKDKDGKKQKKPIDRKPNQRNTPDQSSSGTPQEKKAPVTSPAKDGYSYEN